MKCLIGSLALLFAFAVVAQAGHKTAPRCYCHYGYKCACNQLKGCKGKRCKCGPGCKCKPKRKPVRIIIGGQPTPRGGC